MIYSLMRVIAPGEYKHLLQHPSRLAPLWYRLDEYTKEGVPVVIVDSNGEIRAGNLLGAAATIDKGTVNIFAL